MEEIVHIFTPFRQCEETKPTRQSGAKAHLPELRRCARDAGFTLVELSIVLVILGLLVGGVLAGQNLIRAAELRNVLSEFSNYQTAAISFRDKYFAMPGDMDNATDFWGVAAGTTGSDSTCRDTVQLTQATCNGGGNGEVDSYNGYENFLFWKHLVNAGLTEGSYTGSYADTGYASPYVHNNRATPGRNIPLSKLSGAAWDMANYGGGNVAFQKFTTAYPTNARPYYTNALHLISTNLSPLNGEGGPLTPEEAWNIDTKADDGLPGSGRIEAHRGGGSTTVGPCATTAEPTTAEYDLDDEGACFLTFVRGLNY